MQRNMRLGRVFNCEPVSSTKELSPLEKWYNELLEKTESQLTISDVMKMIRQNVFLEIAVGRAIVYLKKDTLIGEMYEGELLDKISKLDKRILGRYINDLKEIIIKCRQECITHEWGYEGEKEEIDKVLNLIDKKING